MDRAPPWLWPKQGRRHQKCHSLAPTTYFVFVEDVAPLSSLDAAEGPDGKAITELVSQMGKEPLRFRLAVVETGHFGEIAHRIDALDHTNINDRGRDLRRSQLQEAIADMPIPLVDVYAARESGAARGLRAVMRPGNWHYAVFRWNEYEEDFPSAVMGDPELGADFSRRGMLAYLAPVYPNILLRLQDIFSLIHLPDARFGTDERGGGVPLGPIPGGDDGGEAVSTASLAVEDWHAVEPELPQQSLRGEA